MFFEQMIWLFVASLSRRIDLDSMGYAPSGCTKYSVGGLPGLNAPSTDQLDLLPFPPGSCP